VSEVFRLHRTGLVRLAAFIVGDRGTGEDVVQDVFVRVHQRGHPVDGDLPPYLRAAVVNSGISPGTVKSITARGLRDS
jgi:DNA-directed RNA polymerase specialized sigma24 family protein